jgi:hypothetical protein
MVSLSIIWKTGFFTQDKMRGGGTNILAHFSSEKQGGGVAKIIPAAFLIIIFSSTTKGVFH